MLRESMSIIRRVVSLRVQPKKGGSVARKLGERVTRICKCPVCT